MQRLHRSLFRFFKRGGLTDISFLRSFRLDRYVKFDSSIVRATVTHTTRRRLRGHIVLLTLEVCGRLWCRRRALPSFRDVDFMDLVGIEIVPSEVVVS